MLTWQINVDQRLLLHPSHMGSGTTIGKSSPELVRSSVPPPGLSLKPDSAAQTLVKAGARAALELEAVNQEFQDICLGLLPESIMKYDRMEKEAQANDL